MSTIAGAVSGAVIGIGIGITAHGNLPAGIPLIVVGTVLMVIAQVSWMRRRKRW